MNFNNLSISKRLIINASLFIIFLLSTTYIYDKTLKKSTTAFEDLMSEEQKLFEHCLNAQSLMALTLDLESQFKHRPTDRLLTLHSDSISKLENELSQVSELSKDINNQNVKNDINKAIGLKNSTKTKFNELVDSYKKRGFTHTQGLQAQFSDLALKLMKKLERHQIEEQFLAAK